MKLLTRWIKIVLILILFGLGMAIISVLNFFGSEPEMVSAPIPQDTEFLVRVDAKTFWRKGIYSMIFESQNDTLIDNQFKKVIDSKVIKRSNNLIPIDLNKDIILFTVQHNRSNYTVGLFQIMNIDRFHKFTFENRRKNVLAFNIDNSGYMITGPANCSKTDLESVKEKIKRSPVVAFEELGNRSDFITFKSGVKPNTNGYEIGVQQSKEAWTFNGKITTPIDFEPMKYVVKNKGLTLTLSGLPNKTAKLALNEMPGNRDLHLMKKQMLAPYSYLERSKLNGVSFDFEGVDVENEIEGIPSVQGILPLFKFNAVFRFEKELNLDSVMAMYPKSVRTSNSTIKLYNTTYHFQLIDKHHLFIGMDKNAVIPGSRADVITLKGDLSNLTKIGGTSFFVVTVLRGYTPILATTNFAKATNPISFTVQKESERSYIVSGKVPFKEGKNSINEIFRLIVILNGGNIIPEAN